MATDLYCKICEGSGESEIAILLVSDLTPQGQLPLPIGPRCLPVYLYRMYTVFGIWEPENEIVRYEQGSPGALAAQEDDEAAQDELNDSSDAEPPEEPEPVPTPTRRRSGRSQRATSAPAAGNGPKSPARRTEINSNIDL